MGPLRRIMLRGYDSPDPRVLKYLRQLTLHYKVLYHATKSKAFRLYHGRLGRRHLRRPHWRLDSL
jgi:hypothetical protein